MHGPSPEQVGYLLESGCITKKSPRLRYMIGPVSEKLAVGLKKMLPSGLFEWAIMRSANYFEAFAPNQSLQRGHGAGSVFTVTEVVENDPTGLALAKRQARGFQHLS